MNHSPAKNLDHFETALLNELQTEVAHQALVTSRPQVVGGPARWQHRRGWQLTGAAAAAALAVALLVPALAPTPAYAVTERNGEVNVRVNRLEGAEALERALAEHEIVADITYLQPNKQCAAGRYAAVATPGLMLSVAATWFEVTIPAGTLGEGDTFVLDASVEPHDDGFRARVNFDIGHGAVAPCKIVDSP